MANVDVVRPSDVKGLALRSPIVVSGLSAGDYDDTILDRNTNAGAATADETEVTSISLTRDGYGKPVIIER